MNMKKRIKNKALEEVLAGVAHLGTFPMPGDLTLAVISARKELKKALEIYNDSCKQIGESRCEKDKDGTPLSVFQKDDNGQDLINYPKKLKFKDATAEMAAVEEVNKLGEQEIEIDVREFDSTVVESLSNITPIQMEALENLIEIKFKEAAVKPLQFASPNGMH
jgi:hypothetical protein